MKFKLDYIFNSILFSFIMINFIPWINTYNISKNNLKEYCSNMSNSDTYYYHGYEAHLHYEDICPKLVQDGKLDGQRHGMEHGYSGLEKEYLYIEKDCEQEVYECSYKDEYDKSYNKAYREAIKEVELVIENGYKSGLQGKLKETNNYNHKLLKVAYETFYELGYNEYKKVEAKKYEEYGRNHGYNGISKIQFDNQIQEYISAYEIGYYKGIKQRQNELYN